MIKIAGIALAVIFCSLVLKQNNSVYSVMISIIGGVLIFAIVSDKISSVLSSIIDLSSSINGAYSYIKLMIKVLGVILVSQLLSDICRDNGESALSSMVEISARMITISMVIPLFENVISIVTGLLK